MPQRKSLIWFTIIAFAISWPLFLASLLFQDLEPTSRQGVLTAFFASAMWGPGIAAILVTRVLEKKPLKSLRLNTLGPKRFYAWAWFLPPVLIILSGLLTVLLGTGELDTGFTFMKQQMEQTSTQLPVPAGALVAIQILQALILGPLINLIFAMGEEIGWRGFLLPRLMPLGEWRALILSGMLWGIWHAPAIAQGHNYPDHPILGIFLMTVFCILLGIIFGWLYLNTRSPWVAGIAHGSLNAWAGMPFLFLSPGFDTALGGTVTSLTGFVVLGLFIGWLVLTKRLPVQVQEEALEFAG
jgi:membrane protease YdiL (CAAX protease family)